MMQQYDLQLPPFKRGFHLITREVLDCLGPLPEKGLLHVFIHHTSAGIMINENADPSVWTDLESGFNVLAPEDMDYYTHTMEGSDDMPAHIKSALSGVSIMIPIKNGRVALGTWQGIFLCEFRNHGGSRKLTLTVMGV